MSHNKVYGICESKCHVQTIAGYASLAALNESFTADTPLSDIYSAMEDNTSITYGITSTSPSARVYPKTVVQAAGTTRCAVVTIEKVVDTAAVTFKHMGDIWISDIYIVAGSVRVAQWSKIV